MRDNIIIIDLEKDEVQKDLDQAIYMLHYLEGGFTKEEIRNVCFTLKHIIDNLHNQKKTTISVE